MSGNEASPRLLVAIPCLNEAATLPALLALMPKTIGERVSVDVLVVDDGSTDATSEVASVAGVKCIRHGANRGVGRAFQTALDFAVEKGYDYMVNIDGDGQFSPSDIGALMDPLLKGEAEMATASRFLDKTLVPRMPFVKRKGNWAMSLLVSKLTGKRFYDVSCGFRAYSRSALLQLNLHGAFTYTQETFLDFCAKSVRIVEVPISVRYFTERKSRVAGSILKYAINTGAILFKGYRDYYPLKFFTFLSLFFAIPATMLATVFFGRYLITGKFTGYLFIGFTSAFMFMISFGLFILGIVADMLDRIRTNQERILFLLKSRKH